MKEYKPPGSKLDVDVGIRTKVMNSVPYTLFLILLILITCAITLLFINMTFVDLFAAGYVGTRGYVTDAMCGVSLVLIIISVWKYRNSKESFYGYLHVGILVFVWNDMIRTASYSHYTLKELMISGTLGNIFIGIVFLYPFLILNMKQPKHNE